MALNNLGLGFVLTAKDMASAVFNGVGKAMGRMQNKSKDISQGMIEAAGQAKTMGLVLMGVGLAGAAGLGAAAKESAKFQSSVSRIATIADKAQFPMEKIRSILFDMGSQFGGDLNVQADALYSAIGSGAATAADATAVLTAANQLAIGGLTTVDIAMTGLMGTLNAYGLKLTDATMVSDNFFAAVKLGGSDMVVGKLSEGLGRIAPIAAGMNVKLHELTGTIAALTSVGIKTDEAVTGMKAVFDSIIKPAEKARTEAKRLGIEFNTAALKSKGFEQFVLDLVKNPKLAADSMEKLFGSSTEALNAMLAISKDPAKFQDFLKQVKNSGGAASEAFTTLAQTGTFAATVLKSNLQQAIIKIGDVIAPIIGRILVGVNSIVKVFNNLPGPVRTALVGFAALAMAGMVVVGALLAVAGTIAGWIAIKAVLVPALAAVAVAFVALAAAAAPIILIGGTLFLLWSRNAGGFADMVTAAVSKVKLAFDALGQLFSSGQFSGSVLKELNAGNSGVKNFAIQVFLWFNRIKNFFSGIGRGFEQAMAAAKPAFQAFTAELGKLGAMFGMQKDAPDAAKRKFQEWGDAGARVGSVVGKVVELITIGMTGVLAAVRLAVKTFQFFEPSWNNLKTAASGLGKAIDEMKVAFGGAAGEGTDLTSVFKFLGMVIGSMVIVGIEGITFFIGIVAAGMSFLNGVVGAARYVWEGLSGGISGAIMIIEGLLTGNWSKVWAGAQKVIQSWAKGVLGVILSLVSGVAGAIDKLGAIFGKDLGLKKGVDALKDKIMAPLEVKTSMQRGMAGAPGDKPPVQPGAPGPGKPGVGVAPPSSETAPGAAAAGGNAAAMAAIAAAASKPPAPVTTNVNLKSTLTVDGAVLAETVQKHQQGGAARGFGPTQAPT